MNTKEKTQCDICGKKFVNVELHKTLKHKRYEVIVYRTTEEERECYLQVYQQGKLIDELEVEATGGKGNLNAFIFVFQDDEIHIFDDDTADASHLKTGELIFDKKYTFTFSKS